MHTIAKESPDSAEDGRAMAAAVSWEARGDCIAAGKPRKTALAPSRSSSSRSRSGPLLLADTRTPAAWLDLLSRASTRAGCASRTGMGVCDAYYEGDHRLAFATAKFREAFGSLFAAIADNWCQIVVDSKAERLEGPGLPVRQRPRRRQRRVGHLAGQRPRRRVTWRTPRRSSSARRTGSSSRPPARATRRGSPPSTRRRSSSRAPPATGAAPRRAEEVGRRGRLRLRQRLPARRRREVPLSSREGARRPRCSGRAASTTRAAARPRRGPGRPAVQRPTMLRGGRSDLHRRLPIQDALNKLLSDMLIGSEYQAFPQRVLLGVEIPKDPSPTSRSRRRSCRLAVPAVGVRTTRTPRSPSSRRRTSTTTSTRASTSCAA
jgi:hypothetical protein